MVIDSSSQSVLGSSPGKFKGLDLLTPFYLGGVPMGTGGVAAAAAADTGIGNGFVGKKEDKSCKVS